MKNKTLGLYLHIPFCVRKCAYCDFLSFPAEEDEKSRYTEALIREIEAEGRKTGDFAVDSIFFGGGTPTTLSSESLKAVMKALKDNFDISPGAEITMEMNPGTDREELDDFIAGNINRISLGLQSMDDRELLTLGRIHRAEDFIRSFAHMRKLGIRNLSVDLMSALPGQTEKSWQRTLELTAGLEPEHISAYSLIVEEGTPFYELNEKGRLALPDEEAERRMYADTGKILASRGYHRYEISNYAREGFESRHNRKYWTLRPYLGLGLGASSFLRGMRWHNTEKMAEYLSGSGSGPAIWRDKTVLTEKDLMEEFIFLGLRLMEGVSCREFQRRFGRDIHEVYGSLPDRLISEGFLREKSGRLALTERGIDVSNSVMSEFILTD